MGWLLGFFQHPALLAGASAGSIPVIIHLLNKQRFKKLIWAAMHWLWAAQKKSSRRLRVEQLILLLIRILILVLLALALARPALQEGMGLLSGRSSIHRVIVLDNSYSMGHLVGGKALFEKAKDLAVQLVEKLNPSDDVDVLLLNSPPDEFITNKGKLSEVTGDIRAAKLSDDGTHLLRGIAGACKRIAERQSHNIRREIVVLTDQTRAGWETGTQPKKVSAPEEEQISKVFEDPKTKPKIWVVRLSGGNSRENVAAVNLSIDEKVAAARVETRLLAAVRNFGLSAVQKVSLSLYVDGEKVGHEELPFLAAQKTETVVFQHNFAESGSHGVSVALDPDNLPADNSSFLALDVEEQVKVLCVDGRQSTKPLQSEMDFFRMALSPTRGEEVNAGRMPLSPEVISDGAFPETSLENYRLVVLANVALIPADKIEALKQYVVRGGSLWIWLGERIDPSLYNKDLGALLPALLGEPVGSGNPEGESEALSDKELSHPAVSKLGNIQKLPLRQMRVFRRFKLKPKASKEPGAKDAARTVLAYENGDPAAVESRLGEGRVLLMSTTANTAWCNWPGKGLYLPLINLLALDLIQPSYQFRNRMVGENFEYRLPKQEVAAVRRDGLKLLDPANEPFVMDVRTETFSAVSKATPRAGLYTAEIPGEAKRLVHFAANRNSEESDLDPIEDAEIRACLPASEGAAPERGRFFDSAPVMRDDLELVGGEDFGQIESALKKHASGKEIWRWMVMAVLALLVAESILAQRFGNFNR